MRSSFFASVEVIEFHTTDAYSNNNDDNNNNNNNNNKSKMYATGQKAV
jgi:hypothetical protein